MASILSRMRTLANELGRWNAALYLLGRAMEGATRGRVCIRKYYIVAQPIRPGQPMRADANTQLKLVSPGDACVADFPRPAEVIAKRYSDGGQCLAAIVRDAFAGYLWWQHDKYEEDEVRCTYVLLDNNKCVWDYDVYVEPQYRLGRTLARLWSHANDELARRGIRWTFSRISAFNAASLSSHARLGMQARETATFLLLGPVQISLISAAPFLHVSMSALRRPVVKLAAPADTA